MPPVMAMQLKDVPGLQRGMYNYMQQSCTPTKYEFKKLQSNTCTILICSRGMSYILQASLPALSITNNFNWPMNMLASNQPFSTVVSPKSLSAIGTTKDTPKISTESAAIARPDTVISKTWKNPNPARLSCCSSRSTLAFRCFGDFSSTFSDTSSAVASSSRPKRMLFSSICTIQHSTTNTLQQWLPLRRWCTVLGSQCAGTRHATNTTAKFGSWTAISSTRIMIQHRVFIKGQVHE